MKEQPLTDALLRQYLLGKVDEEERQRIESLFITDVETKERILVAEQELTDDYLDGRLASEDRQIFLRHYANTPAQQRRLRIAKSINDWIDTTATASAESVPASTVSLWDRLRELVRQRRMVVLPIAATATIAILVSALLLNSWREQRSRERAIEQKIARTNVDEVPPRMEELTLAPVSVRGGDSRNELVKRTDIQNVELHLTWIQKDRYSTYRAVVRRPDKDTPLTFDGLKLGDDGAVRLRLLTADLVRGLYRVQLTGVTPQGGTGFEEEYRFTVRE